MVAVTTDSSDQLGWPRVLDALGKFAASDLGAAAIANLRFCPDADSVRTTLERVGCFMRLMEQSESTPPLEDVEDVDPAFTRVARGGAIGVDTLYAITRTVRTMVRVRRYLLHHGKQLAPLEVIADGLPDAQMLSDELAATFDATGGIRDDASSELSSARRRLTQLRVAIKKRLEDYIHRREIAEWLQDDYYTLREERYVIPIVSSFQGKIDGIIHGASNTGQTVFVEPQEFIAANNDLTVAAGAVEAAVHAVVKERTEWIRAEVDELRTGLATLVRIDTLVARARLAAQMEARVPSVAVSGPVTLQQARNPILTLRGNRVVANDIVIDAEQAFLVVTGPNTGGKTVTLNTLGLCTLMAWAGLPIPVDADSTVVLFDAVHALIGDAQDIGQDLSTFSGHVKALKNVLDDASDGALVLLDEIAVGTEPQQGAGLAIAVLESLANRGARGLVTTHYERLKTLPFEDARFGNASVGVAPETMEPTFELQYGQPGSSTPLEVAARLGIAGHIVSRAREVAGGNSGLTEALERLRQAEHQAETAAREAREAKARLDAERQRVKKTRAAIVERADDEVRQLRSEARSALDRAMRSIKDARRDLSAVREARELEKRTQALRAVKEELQTMSDSDAQPQPPSPAPGSTKNEGPHDAGDLSSQAMVVGQEVWVRTLGRPGTIMDTRGSQSAQVAVGGLKLTLKRKDLGMLGLPEAPPSAPPVGHNTRHATPSGPSVSRSKPRRIGPDEPMTPPPRTDAITLDLRGMRVDEIEQRLDIGLDQAYCANREVLWIIHGHGTGALKKEVRGLIRRSSYVEAWRPGLRHEGGDGVTLAWLHRD